MWVGKLECAIIFLSAIIFLTSIQNSQTTNKKREMDPGTRVLCAWRTKAVFLSATESREKRARSNSSEFGRFIVETKCQRRSLKTN